MNQRLRDAAETMKNVLELQWEPVAVTFLHDTEPVSGYEALPNRRYCQMVMEARRGRKVILTAENIACPAAAAAFGFKPLPPKLASGEMLAAFGIFGSPAAGKATIDSMRRLEQGQYVAVALSPLAEADLEPDVIVVEGTIEQLMWLALAARFESGGRATFTTAILQATCEDATVLPFLTGELNATLGCYGCREATDLQDQEAVIGFPVRLLDEIVHGLRALGSKALPHVRSKASYTRLAACPAAEAGQAEE
jgi:uncharacterized protein (DUF169 family)